MKDVLLTTTAATPVEVWFQDEARVGQQGSITYVWAPIGSRPPMVRDNRHDSAYLFGAICPDRAVGAAVISPTSRIQPRFFWYLRVKFVVPDTRRTRNWL